MPTGIDVEVVLVLDVVVDEVVGGTVEVVVVGAVVVDVDVVVVPVGWHAAIWLMSGSGPPSSKAITTERP